MPRLFVAIDLPEAIRQKLATICYGLPGARWVSADPNDGQTMHLTVRFIGEVDGGLANNIADALGNIEGKPFDLKVKDTGHFPPRGEPKVIWAGVAANEKLSALRNQIERTLVEQGIEAEKRKYTPHITLARLHDTPADWVARYLSEHALFSCDPFTVSEFHLYSSQLSSKGAIHTKEYTYPLMEASKLSFREKWQKGII